MTRVQRLLAPLIPSAIIVGRWRLMCTLPVGALVITATLATGATLEWDRNTEADMQDYQVYGCFTRGCTVQQTPAMRQPGVVAQPTVGIVPSYVIDLSGKEGALAVSARDTSGNESPLSVPLPFDRVGPVGPSNVRIR